MSNASPLAFLDSSLTDEQDSSVDGQSVSPIVAKGWLGGEKGHWSTVSAKVEGTLEIPDRAAKKTTVRVDKSQIGSNVCIDGAPNIFRIEVESTLSRVREGKSHGGPGSQHFRAAHHPKTRPTYRSVPSL